jgi:H+/Cl- antiporter ClcA
MSATFDSPLAATLLAVELLLFEWKPRSFVPVAVASAAAACVRPHLLGEGPLFPTLQHASHMSWGVVLGCLACGLAAGAMSGILTKGVYFFEDAFLKLPIHWMWWPAIGGLAIGLGGLLEPRALGVGYDVIESLLRGDLVGRVLLVLMVVKATIWVISLGSGTSGGVLAPLLIMGASLGGLEALVFPHVGAGFWPLVSMAAILGGTMRSPLTGVVFALELTHDWGIALPLLVAVPIAHAFTVLVLKRSILTEKVSRRGFHLSREYATDPLEILFVREVMRTAPQLEAVASDGASTIIAHADEPLRIAVSRMAQTGRTSLPVVANGDARAIVGELTLEDALKARVRHLEEEERRERVLPLGAMFPPWRARRERDQLS